MKIRNFRLDNAEYEFIKSFGLGNATLGLKMLIKSVQKEGLIPTPAYMPDIVPIKVKKQREPKYSEEKANYHKMAWEEYSIAYNAKYGTKPVSNQTTFSQMINVCKRLNYKNVEQVIKFYLGHNNRYYSAKAHSVGMLLADCEKLHTEWATNQKITDQKIKSESFGDGIREQLKRLSQNDNIDF